MTMHNDANPGEIAERIVLVGDPNRAKHMAETYLQDAVLVNKTRCAYCYTGTYEGVRVSVMAVGMGVHADLRHRALPRLRLQDFGAGGHLRRLSGGDAQF